MGVESYEIIANENNKNIINDSINGGTSNYAHFNNSALSAIKHGIKDVLPYFFLGNDPLDRSTTNLVERIFGIYKGNIPQYMPEPWPGVKK
jgi:hypothetical protein